MKSVTMPAVVLSMATTRTSPMAQPGPVDVPSLWVTDDAGRMAYQITFDGDRLLSSFARRPC